MTLLIGPDYSQDHSVMEGLGFEEVYAIIRGKNPVLPEYPIFIAAHEEDISLFSKCIAKEREWCREAKRVLDASFGEGQYHAITIERGARDIRHILQTMGVDVTPFIGNGYFFKDRHPDNWTNVSRYLTNLGLNSIQTPHDSPEIVVIDTAFAGTVIKGLSEFMLLQLPDIEDNRAYADRITNGRDPAEEIVIVGYEDYGLRNELARRGLATSDFTYLNHKLSRLTGNRHIDDCLEGGIRAAHSLDGIRIISPTDKLKSGQKLVFVTTEVDPENPDYAALLSYLDSKGFLPSELTAFHRQVNQAQAALANKIHGFLVTASGGMYPELISPNYAFSRIGVTMESTPKSTNSVSRDKIDASGNIQFAYNDLETQLTSLLFQSMLLR